MCRSVHSDIRGKPRQQVLSFPHVGPMQLRLVFKGDKVEALLTVCLQRSTTFQHKTILFIDLFVTCMADSLQSTCAPHVCPVPTEARKLWIPQKWTTDDYEPPHLGWEWKERPVLQSAEPSLQSPLLFKLVPS